MLNWAKQTLGVTDHIYGPSAIQSVAEQAKETPYTEITKDELAWEVVEGTNVETKTFYLLSETGRIGMLQVIYSNVMGIRTTAQFNCKIHSSEAGKEHLWSSHNLSSFTFSKDKQDFTASNCSMSLSEDGSTYHIKSSVDPKTIIDVKISRTMPGFVVGKDGNSNFGTDPKKPWGRMRHIFWPRCSVEGSIMTQQGPVDFAGRAMFVHALQGMKPHFAAAKWNFCNFQSPTYSAMLMEFTTPESYGKTVVSVGSIATDSGLVMVGASPSTKAEHTKVKGDPDNDWPEPSAVKFTWVGKTQDGKAVEAEVGEELGTRVDRVDVMGEMPKFVKQIVAGAAGTKPYIYQYTPKMKIKVKVGDEIKEEEGQLFMEATFIS